MQFHLNGYRPGDPAIAEPYSVMTALPALPGEVDVLIIGCGPAGLTLAAQLAVFPDVTTRIIDQKPGPLLVGQADGIACRTMEMFQAFGFADQVLRESCWINQTCFWKPDETKPGTIMRSGRIQDTEDGLSEFPHVILNQARIHDFYLEAMRNSPSRLEPDYGRTLLDLVVAEAGPIHRVTATLERRDDVQVVTETVRARYVVGCDGARSFVRRAIGRALHGDSANQAWGVMDILAVTDFPDIRMKVAIHSASEGSLLIIPREGGYLVRFYIELDKLAVGERVADRNITVERLIFAAGRILHPYTLDVKEVAWWSVYEIGQRLCDQFDDGTEVAAPDGAGRQPAVFIVGDACHTHSPKAGQGMNVSMQDGFNLGWKLASVLRGQAAPRLLGTYSAERQAVARELIDFDREFARMFSAAPKRAGDAEGDGVDPAEFQRYFARQGRFTAGTATQYGPSLIVGDARHQALASGFVIGTRFHSAPVLRLADARPMELGHVVAADGRWRMFIFAGAGALPEDNAAVWSLCAYLLDSPESPIRLYTPAGSDVDSVFDVRIVLQDVPPEMTAAAMPALALPQKGKYGLTDYEKVYQPDHRAGDIYDLRSIDRAKGCLVVVRPDQYVANVLPLDGYDDIADFFGGFMNPCRTIVDRREPAK